MASDNRTTGQPPVPGPTDVVTVKPGQVARQEFGASEMQASAETAGGVLAARARAMVEARFVMAMRRPRDWDNVRALLLRACERPGFAGHMTEKVWGAAWYRKPVGEGVEGFSIRFAEEALRAMTNVDVETTTVYEDDAKRIVTVSVTDLESNLSFPTTLVLTKTVERNRLAKGQVALKTRINSRSEPVYLVEATEDEVFTKQQNLVSKAMRNGALRLLPGDIQSECRTRILAIRHGDVAKDPDKVRRELSDGFNKLNILPSMLKEYLGHDLATATPAELADLRDLWVELKEGRVTWAEVMAGPDPEADKAPAAAATAPLDAVTAKLRAEQGAQPAGGFTPAAAAAPPAVQAAAAQAPAPAAAAAPAPSTHPADQEGADKEPPPPPAAPEPTGSGPFAKAVDAVRRAGRRSDRGGLEE